MSIYPVLPYVYQCVHKITGKIYIGSRVANKSFSHLDFPQYRTSSNYVRPIFDEFDWFIIAEFFNPKDAYDFEQQLINEQWQVSKEMSLNKVCYYGKKSFNTIGYNLPLSEETKQNMRKPKPNLKGKPKSKEHKQNMKRSEEFKRNMSKIIDVLTPDGFVIENTTMKELCSQFGLIYISVYQNFRKGKSYKGFYKL